MFTLQSNNLSRIREIYLIGILYLQIKVDSMKQCVEPESTTDLIRTLGTESECKLIIKEGVLKRAEALSLTSMLVHNESMQPLECAEV